VTTATEIIKSALRKINSYQSGDQLAAPDANDSLEVLNDMIDSWSTDHAYVYASVETVVQFTPLQYIYSIGPGGNFAIDLDTGAAIPRPLRITNGFTRNSELDYPIDVTMDQGQYTQFLLKNQPAPWPLVAWYNPTMPTGTLYFYPNPSSAGELHLFIDQILSEFANLTTDINLPQGYSRALKWGLARELCAEFGFPLTPNIEKLAKESLDMIKSLNEVPAPVSNFDASLLNLGSRGDYSWILHGGFSQ
jgi:hypothetical protein